MTSIMRFMLLLFGTIALVLASNSRSKMNVMYEWKYIDYVWDSPEAKQAALSSGEYNLTKPILIDVDHSRDGRTFVTMIRRQGVPASLGVVSNQTGPGGPLVKPFPNWSWYKKGDCNNITNVYRIAIDKCNRLWILDNGMIDGQQICSAQLIIFNLNTNRLMQQVPIPNEVSKNSKTLKGMLITPIVQTEEAEGKRCNRSRVFIADVDGNGLIVVTRVSKMWRLDGPYFAPDPSPNSDVSTIAGEKFKLTDGLFGMALSPKIGSNPQYLAFRPYASRSLYASTVDDILKTDENCTLRYINYTNVLPSQSTAQAFSSEATLFFGLTGQTAIGCWNQYKPMVPENIDIAAQDKETLQFASGVKVIPATKNHSEELWVSTNRYQKIALGTMNFNEVNYRVLKQSVKKIIAGTKCKAPKKIQRQISYTNLRN